MKLAHNVYPSHVAKILAYEVGLISDMESEFRQFLTEKARDEIDLLIEFQQMSLVNTFEDCLVVYYGIKLSQEQITNLRIIYEITPKLLPAKLFDDAIATITREKHSVKPNMTVIANSLHTAINILTSKKVA